MKVKYYIVMILALPLLSSCDILGGVAQGMLMGAGMGSPYGGYNAGYSSTSNAILSSEMQMANSASRLNSMGVSTYGSSSSSKPSSGSSSSSGTKKSYYTCCQSTPTFGQDPGKHKCANCGFMHTKNSGHTCPIK